MQIKLVVVGKLKENYFKDAIAEYAKRISRFAEFSVVEVDEHTFCGVPNDAEIEKILKAEGQSILQKVEGCVVALDIDGKQLSSEQIAEELEKFTQRFSVITFVIGGSYGLSNEVKSRVDLRLSFGKITLPHQLCRVVLCEQIYRAFAIRNHLPYHK